MNVSLLKLDVEKISKFHNILSILKAVIFPDLGDKCFFFFRKN